MKDNRVSDSAGANSQQQSGAQKVSRQPEFREAGNANVVQQAGGTLGEGRAPTRSRASG